MNGPHDVTIIGAGVLGCAIAYHLAGAGLKPLVIERRGIAEGEKVLRISPPEARELVRKRGKKILLIIGDELL
jgi:flavin-dependent dehydrogenase